MAQSTSYPSPNSAQVGEGPFYASQHHVPTEDVQTSAPQPRRAQPTTGGRDVETDERVQTVRNPQELRHIQIASPQQIAQSGLESAQSYDHNSGDPSSRKRTKVSRACDECRRKKVCSLLIRLFGVDRRPRRPNEASRYDAMRPLRRMTRNAQAANVLTCFVCLAEHHKREVQVKGKGFSENMHVARR